MTHLRYLWYVLKHKWYVFRAGLVLGVPFWSLLIHDLSKFSWAEWGAYVWVQDFNRAWLHHWQNNPHHPEYWAGGEDTTMLSSMPDVYVREMVADWYGAGMAQDKPDIAGWYQDHGAKRAMHEVTRQRVEEYLNLLKVQGLIP